METMLEVSGTDAVALLASRCAIGAAIVATLLVAAWALAALCPNELAAVPGEGNRSRRG